MASIGHECIIVYLFSSLTGRLRVTYVYEVDEHKQGNLNKAHLYSGGAANLNAEDKNVFVVNCM